MLAQPKESPLLLKEVAGGLLLWPKHNMDPPKFVSGINKYPQPPYRFRLRYPNSQKSAAARVEVSEGAQLRNNTFDC